MSERLSKALIELLDPRVRAEFFENAESFIGSRGLDEGDALALNSRSKGLFHYQLVRGDLRDELIKNKVSFRALDEHEFDHFHFEHEEEDHDSGAYSFDVYKDFGPFARRLGIEYGDSDPRDRADKGSLTIAGGGIGVGHLTREAEMAISAADIVLFCVADPTTEYQIRALNSSVEDLHSFYGNGKLRSETYKGMADRIIQSVRQGQKVCGIFYGHPGFFVRPAHLAIRQARQEGFEAFMLPAPSCVDSLCADLGIDLSWDGCQILEATQFLLRDRAPDVESGLILLQAGSIGDPSFSFDGFDKRHFRLLAERLIGYYGQDFEVVLYEGSPYPLAAPRVDVVPLAALTGKLINGITTIYLPPLRRANFDQTLATYFRENAPNYAEDQTDPEAGVK